MSEQSAALTRPAKDPNQLISFLDTASFKKELERALPNALKPERIVRLAITVIRGSEALVKCTPLSIMACVVESAQLGLEIERLLGHAYIVPFGDQASLIVGYRGFAHLMYQSGSVIAVSTEIVRKGDKFKRTLGTNRGLLHEPAPIPEKDNPDTWLGAYATTKLISGNIEFEYLERVKVENARARSKSWQNFLKYEKTTPWKTDPEEMWRKTPLRRLAKRMPVSTTDKRAELLRATMIDEYGDRRGLLVPTLHGFEVNENPPERELDADPIEPTTEASDSSATNEEKKQETKRKPAPAAAKKPIDVKPTSASSGVPKAAIPPAEDPVIDGKQQTDIFSAAVANGWKVPEEVNDYLKKKYGITSIRQVRKSQFAAVLQVMKAGT